MHSSCGFTTPIYTKQPILPSREIADCSRPSGVDGRTRRKLLEALRPNW